MAGFLGRESFIKCLRHDKPAGNYPRLIYCSREDLVQIECLPRGPRLIRRLSASPKIPSPFLPDREWGGRGGGKGKEKKEVISLNDFLFCLFINDGRPGPGKVTKKKKK